MNVFCILLQSNMFKNLQQKQGYNIIMIVKNVEEIQHVYTCKARTCSLSAKYIIVLFVYLFIETDKQIEFVNI